MNFSNSQKGKAMATRKYNFNELTQAQLEDIQKTFPLAVVSRRQPVYKVLAMLMECGVEVPHLMPAAQSAAQNIQSANSTDDLPGFLKREASNA